MIKRLAVLLFAPLLLGAQSRTQIVMLGTGSPIPDPGPALPKNAVVLVSTIEQIASRNLVDGIASRARPYCPVGRVSHESDFEIQHPNIWDVAVVLLQHVAVLAH